MWLTEYPMSFWLFMASGLSFLALMFLEERMEDKQWPL